MLRVKRGQKKQMHLWATEPVHKLSHNKYLGREMRAGGCTWGRVPRRTSFNDKLIDTVMEYRGMGVGGDFRVDLHVLKDKLQP